MGLLAIPLLVCCGFPVVVGILAATSALTRGIFVGVIVALVGTVSWLVLRRHTRANDTCCVSPSATRNSSESLEVDKAP